jgi:RimJ/RimL family protein N-acetyltransferase
VPIIAETKRLRLRTWKHGDGVKLHQYCNTVHVMQRLGGVQSLRLLRDDIRWFRQSWTESGMSYWVVERKEAYEFLGFCGLDLLTRDHAPALAGEVEIGWRLREDAWGHGYATEAARVVLDIAFRIRRLERVVSRTDIANEASVNVMRKLGMRQWFEKETDVEELVYSINREGWLSDRLGARADESGCGTHKSCGGNA